MPRLSVLMIRSALLHFVVGWALGAAILWQKGLGGWPTAWNALPLHLHMALIGWIGQLALGMAYWIAPRFVRATTAQGNFVQSRGREGLAWTGAALINASTLAALLAGPAGIEVGAGIALLGVMAFALHLWARIKPYRSA